MTPRQRLRRAALLATHTICNIASYRGGRASGNFVRSENFWLRLNGNFLDIALLDWSKIYGDSRGAHHWRKILSDPAAFERALLQKLAVTRDQLDAYIKSVRAYRDKFVAHLDSEPIAHIPKLDLALESAKFLLEYVHSAENQGNYFEGIPKDAERLYKATLADARKHYVP